MLAQLNTRRRDREPRLTGLHDPDQLRPRWQIPNLKMLWVAILISALSLLGYGMVNRLSFSAESFVPIHENLGAIPSATGTHFRVWAPHAEKVSVMGSFNQWSAEADPMKAEGDGYWVAEIANAHPGDEYQYAIVNEESHETFYRIDPYARQVTHSMGNSIIYDPTFDWGDSLDYTPPPLDDLVLYEMHIGTFVDEPGDRPGTFDSAIEQLPHIKELGANVIELLPVVEFSGDYSWGYNPSHPFAVESAYGGPHAFKRFIKAAHEQGLGIILDVVYNHFGPSDLSLWQFDGWSPDGKDTGGLYFYNDWRARTMWAHTRPNFKLPQSRQLIEDNVRMWLEEFHLDGLRWDSTVNFRTVDNGKGAKLPDGVSLMREMNKLTHSYQPYKITIAEDHSDTSQITQDPEVHGIGFDSQWDPKFVHPIRDAITADEDSQRNLREVAWALNHRYSTDPFERIIYTESHDEVGNGTARVPYDINYKQADSWDSRKRSSLGGVFVLTAPGTPMLFQGQEILEDEWFQDSDPIDWSKRDRFSGIFDLYQDLVALRRNTDDVSQGLRGASIRVHHLDNHQKVMAYHRWDRGGPGDDVIVVVNLSGTTYDRYSIGFPEGGTWKVRFNSDDRRYGADYGGVTETAITATPHRLDGMDYSGTLTLPPYSALILSQNRLST
ncbi:MAG: alpha-amylase family glycosyl hydrolase [Prochlorotrichaceae cyanobacterium]